MPITFNTIAPIFERLRADDDTQSHKGRTVDDHNASAVSLQCVSWKHWYHSWIAQFGLDETGI
jgi:hypothetical protein